MTSFNLPIRSNDHKSILSVVPLGFSALIVESITLRSVSCLPVLVVFANFVFHLFSVWKRSHPRAGGPVRQLTSGASLDLRRFGLGFPLVVVYLDSMRVLFGHDSASVVCWECL